MKTRLLFHQDDLFGVNAEPAPPYTASAVIYDHMMKEVNYRGWARYLILLMKTAGLESRRAKISGEKLCEFACGTGNISFIMSKLGFDVTGVDSSAGMLAVATAKLGRRRAANMRLVHHDMVTYSERMAFNRAICVYDSINYISTADSIGRFFASVFESLKPGGVFVFDASLESNSLNDSSLFVQKGKYRGIYYHRKSQYDPRARIHTTYVRVKNGDRVIEEIHREFVYDLPLIRKLFTDAGFQERFAAADFTMLEANDNSERVHFVLVKPEHD